MTIYGRKITKKDLDAMALYMDDEIREKIHRDLAPCTPEEFLTAYLYKDENFRDVLEGEFGLETDGTDVIYYNLNQDTFWTEKEINDRISGLLAEGAENVKTLEELVKNREIIRFILW